MSKTSQYRGVTWSRLNGTWKVRMTNKGKSYYLGYFYTEEEAAKVYNIMAKKLYGNAARLNKGV